MCYLQGLIPSQEEKKKQRQFLAHLDSLVCSDWPGAKLFLYLAVDDENFTKAQLVVKMAEILRSDNMQNVQVGMLILKREGGGETV